MTDVAFPTELRYPGLRRVVSPNAARTTVLIAVGASITASVLATSPDSTAQLMAASGEGLTRLLRFMALLKAAMAIATVAAVIWRLGIAATPLRLLSYAAACAVMSAGPGLIWSMAHVGLGALLLHGGLLAALLMLWRDPAVAARLSALVARRLGGPAGPTG